MAPKPAAQPVGNRATCSHPQQSAEDRLEPQRTDPCCRAPWASRRCGGRTRAWRGAPPRATRGMRGQGEVVLRGEVGSLDGPARGVAGLSLGARRAVERARVGPQPHLGARAHPAVEALGAPQQVAAHRPGEVHHAPGERHVLGGGRVRGQKGLRYAASRRSSSPGNARGARSEGRIALSRLRWEKKVLMGSESPKAARKRSVCSCSRLIASNRCSSSSRVGFISAWAQTKS